MRRQYIARHGVSFGQGHVVNPDLVAVVDQAAVAAIRGDFPFHSSVLQQAVTWNADLGHATALQIVKTQADRELTSVP